MSDLDDFTRIGGADNGLCVVTTVRDDTTVQASVVNAGVVDHPMLHVPVVGLVAAGGSRKLENLRRRPREPISTEPSESAEARYAMVTATVAGLQGEEPDPGSIADRLRRRAAPARHSGELGQGRPKVDSRGRLADTTLLVDHSDDRRGGGGQHLGVGVLEGTYIWWH